MILNQQLLKKHTVGLLASLNKIVKTAAKTLVLALFICKVHGQQTAQFSNFLGNAFYYNPALAGGQSSLVFKSGHRSQWGNIEGAPTTTFASLSTRLFQPKKINAENSLGFGGYFQNDLIGPYKRSSLNFAFAYKLLLHRNVSVAFGLFTGLQQFGFDATKLNLNQSNDPLISGSGKLFLFPDFSVGTYLECKNWYVGLSAKQMFNGNWSNLIGSASSIDQVHYHMMFGQRFENEKIAFSPNILIKKTKGAVPAFDANINVELNSNFSTGISWRNTNSIVCLFNVKLLDMFSLYYSYDLTTSKLRFSGANTHEIMIGFKSNAEKVSKKNDFNSILFH